MKKLYRSRFEKMIAGVCGGIAKYLNVDATIVRLIFVFLLMTKGIGLGIYLILWIIVPLEPLESGEIIEVREKSKPEVSKKETATKKTSTHKSASGDESDGSSNQTQ